ncbi:MAG: hypothetical protein ABFC56_12430 [Clostridiaceae bacterium]
MTAAAYILIIMMHVGPMGDGNSNALATAVFNSKETCEAARDAAEGLARGTVKQIRAVCVKQ